MKITGQSKIIVKRATLLNNALHYDVELWAQLGNNPNARLVAFARKDNTIQFASTNGIHDQMSVEDFSRAIWQVPIEADVELSDDQELKLFDRIINTGTNFGTIRFDLPTPVDKSGQEDLPMFLKKQVLSEPSKTPDKNSIPPMLKKQAF
jgi:hypothetical protein